MSTLTTLRDLRTPTQLTMPYEQFVARKLTFDQRYGHVIEPAEVHPLLKPHQRDLVVWAVAGGRRAVFASYGLGKSLIQIETLRLTLAHHGGGRALIICPLAVRLEFAADAEKIGQAVRFVRRSEEVNTDGIYVTNYESVRDGRLDVNLFAAVSLDEASVLRSFGSKTYQEFLAGFSGVPYRFVATATPSPNRHKELIHYAGFLGVMDTGQALTRFFQRDSTQANNLTIYPHKRAEFHLWLNTWAIFLQRPSDICRCSCHAHIRRSKANDSDTSSSPDGSQERSATGHGSASATAAEATSPRPLTCEPAGSSVAAASDRSTAGRAPALTRSGEGCTTDAGDRSTRIGPTTEVEGSASANVGAPSPPSWPTWVSHPQDTRSTGSTTTATTSPGTADGRPLPSRPRTDVHVGADPCPCDEGYDLPPLESHWHEVAVDHDQAGEERDGQGLLYRGGALDLQGAATEKRRTLADRVAVLTGIVDKHRDDGQIVLWCHLNDEQRAIEKALDNLGVTYSSIYGALDPDEAERRLAQWKNRETHALIGKPVMLGQGMNLQQARRCVFVGIDHKFNDFGQALHRIQRFGQTRTCHAHIIHAESEVEIKRDLLEKWSRHKELIATMTAIVREHGLDSAAINEALQRSLGVDRIEANGEDWTYANNDCVHEVRDHIETGSVGLVVTSIPFANHYEYTPAAEDFGHTDDNAHFWAQMDYLTPELHRVLAPGRIYACHVKDRINFGNVTGAGIPTVSPFHVEAIIHAQKHGFDYLGMITVVTDVVRENNQTYRLSWTEQCKDATKMGVGSPEYVLLFHKPQSDRTKGYADTPVTKSKADYTRARWQIDAHAFWRSSGDRLLTPDELVALPVKDRSRLFTEQTLREVYDYETHVKVGEVLDARGALPATFMSLAPGSTDPYVWHDVNRMLTLNGQQKQRNLAMHVCPLQIDIVDRLINRFSNPGDLVLDPFGGLGTVPYRALHLGRRGRGVELNPGYYLDAVKYLHAAESEQQMPSLFDLLDGDDAA